MANKVNFVDLQAQHEEVRTEIESAFKDIIDNSSFIGGKYVSTFEKEFAAYLGVREAIGVANGTDALWLGLITAGVKPNDAVVTVPNTFIATTEAITRAGAVPLFVDIDMATGSIDINDLRRLLNEDCIRDDNGRPIHKVSHRPVSVLMPVHLYGLPVDMTSLMAVAQEFNLTVIEDACQSHGAKVMYNGEWVRSGTIGAVAGFSFYPGKNLGAMGDAGAVVTNDPQIAEQVRWLRDHGSKEKYVHITPNGWNSRLDALQAAVLSAKLRKLDEWNGRRRQAAKVYAEVLTNLPLDLPVEPKYAEHIYHLYVVRTADREHLRKELASRGIGVALHYPIPLHLQQAYAHLSIPAGTFPKTEEWALTLLSLPMHPALTKDQIEIVGDACRQVLKVGVSF